MAIKRCPYCKAFIEEKDTYCKNCGTQLLFPEDESIEEEIPGEKVVEEETEEEGELEGAVAEEGEIEEFGFSLAEEEDEEEETKDEEGLEEDEEEETEKAGEEDEQEIEEEEEIEERRKELKEKETPYGKEKELLFGEKRVEEKDLEEEGEEEEEDEEELEEEESEEEAEEEWREEEPEEAQRKEVEEEKIESPPLKEELAFKTQDFEKLTGSVDDAKREIEEYLQTLQDKKGREKKGQPLFEEISSPTRVMEEKSTETSEELPPWLQKIKESPPTEILETGEATAYETKELLEKRTEPVRAEGWRADSGIGLPEKITQKDLPFDGLREEREERKEGAKEEGGAVPAEEREEAGAEEKIAPSRLSLSLKAKALDLLLVTILWLISLGLASRVVGVSLFRLISVSTVQVMVFYGILVVSYFFLFIFFLGETLGDRFFSEED